MKKVIVCLSFVVAMGSAFAQGGTTPATTTPTSKIKMYKVEPNSTSATPATTSGTQQTEMTPEQEIAYCNNLLAALDAKEAWIRSNPDELKTAEETGWFTAAEATRAQLKARLKELESK